MMNDSKTIREFPLAVRFPVAVWFQGVLDFKITKVWTIYVGWTLFSQRFVCFSTSFGGGDNPKKYGFPEPSRR